MGLLRTARDALRAQLWPIPVLAVLVAVALGVGLPRLDAHVDDSLPGGLQWLLFGGDAGAARTVADAVGSSMITVTSLTFSLTVVTLQLASSQFSPRLLRNFTSDLFVQVTLALFLATFVYSLTVLRSVRSDTEAQAQFVPRLAVTLSFALAIACVVMLVAFLAHLTRQVRVETMLAMAHRESSRTIEAVLPERDVTREEEIDALLEPHPDQRPILAEQEGFLTWVEQADLVDLARDAQAVVVVTAEPGSFVVRGVPVGHLRPAAARADDPDGSLDDERTEDLCRRVADQIHTGRERTGTQDIAFGLRQLTDVANKALSPGSTTRRPRCTHWATSARCCATCRSVTSAR